MAVVYPLWAGGVFLPPQQAWSSVSLKSVPWVLWQLLLGKMEPLVWAAWPASHETLLLPPPPPQAEHSHCLSEGHPWTSNTWFLKDLSH